MFENEFPAFSFIIQTDRHHYSGIRIGKIDLRAQQFLSSNTQDPVGPTCLIFESDKIVVTGAKSENDITDTESIILKLLSQYFISKTNKQ